MRCGAVDFDQGQRGHAVRVVFGNYFDPALALAHALAAIGVEQVFVQRFVEHLFVARPLANRQRQVGFAGFTVPKLRLQVFERTAFFGDQQDAAGFAVQAVHQF